MGRFMLEAEAHNAPIREARKREREQHDAEREAKRAEEEAAAKEEYETAIRDAETKILNRQTVYNSKLGGDKSLILQLFREHSIAVPLKTQGWIKKSLHDIYFHEGDCEWSYHYYGKPSTVIHEYLARLAAAVETKQQFEDMELNGGGAPLPAVQGECEDENDMEI